MKTDIEIAQSCTLLPITAIGAKLGLTEEQLECYGRYKAKLLPSATVGKPQTGKLILVTAINPTAAGEGKTTTSIGLADSLSALGKKTVLALREPSLGPVFGLKGGATGGGWAQVAPMEDINLHFTGDMHAIGAANNLLAAMVDNHIYQGNALNIDPRRITWKRCVDMNDRQLRFITDGLGGKANGTPREDGFDITVASEVMAIFCLATDLADLKARLGRIVVGYTYAGAPVTAEQIGAAGAMAALLKDAFDPNLVQTLEHTPALVHGGPFANIAQGTNSVLATKMGLSLSDYVVTEAGFGFDLGAEKFMDIKCVKAGLNPSAVVLVATVRALKYHGGAKLDTLKEENTEALRKGIENLEKHVENMKKFNICPVVALNKFITDTDAEIQIIADKCKELNVPMEVAEVWAKGGEGAEKLAILTSKVAEQCTCKFQPLYDWNWSIEKKIETVAKEIYGAVAVDYTAQAKSDLKKITALGLDKLPVCIAKTQKSLSDNPKLLGRPKDFIVTVRQLEIAAGAGFVIPITGEIMRMPGLPDVPAAEHIDIDENGQIRGLF